MRERINRLAKGIIEMETPSLQIQPASIHTEVMAGGLEKKELYITSQNGLHVKGLAYSSNPRVRVVTASFGGLRNHVNYEIDCEYLELGDVIEGVFCLVTNSGEIEVPYHFTVEPGPSGQTLQKLKEPKDFANLAKQDFETAARIFEYRDFTQVPFMRDLKIRCLYDGLLGRGNRYGQVEQFLIALGLKDPVELVVEDRNREYSYLERTTTDTIRLRRNGWGYLPVTVSADGSFLQMGRKNFTSDDFQSGVLDFAYQMSPGGLHGGKNFGSITFETPNASVTVKITVNEKDGRPEKSSELVTADYGDNGQTRFVAHDHFTRYLSLRLQYENGEGNGEELKKQMLQEVEHIRLVQGRSMLVSLMEAELYLLTGRKERARECLTECRDDILKGRGERPDLYCLYEYIYLKLEPDRERWASLGRLTRKYLEDGRGEFLIFHVFTRCEEKYCFENPGELLNKIRVLYLKGCHSPFLYRQALEIFNDAPQLLIAIGGLEVQVLYFGVKRAEIKQELAVRFAKLAATSRNPQPFTVHVLRKLYEKHPKREILEALCGLMIRSDCRREADFPWYEQALSEGISLTRLYEYFLYSLPASYDHLLPAEVLRYFSYDHDLDQKNRAVLYANIVRYMKPDSQLYKDYQRAMGAFAAEQVLASRIGPELAEIYDAMIYPDMVDEPVARKLPSLLRACRITCDDKRMRQVIVCYEELTEEGVYPLNGGVAYVPVYFEGSRILFADAYGNRYAAVSHLKLPVLNKPELMEKCFEMYPEQPMLLLGACRKALEKEKPAEEDVLIISQAMEKLRLHPLYRKALAGQILHYYEGLLASEAETDMDRNMAPLFAVEKDLLSREQRTSMCQILICYGYGKEAYRMIQKYFCPVSASYLRRLCSRMILNQLFDQEELLLKLSFAVFEAEKADSVILDYLCEHFNGSTGQMYRLLVQSVAEHVETYDLEERLLAQMLFSDETDRMDRVFSMYAERKKTSESIVKAYFTMKSSAYFLENKPAGEEVFRYLENMIQKSSGKEKLSTIYLLALSKYYSAQEHLTDEQQSLCQTIVDILLAEGMIFPHFKPLAKHIRIPEDVTDKAILQYFGKKDSRVDLQVRIRPLEERFHSEDMKRVYQGIFIRQKVLFEGEVMEYRIYEQKGSEKILMEEGSLTCDRKTEGEDSRFRLLNQMSMFMELKEEPGLKQAMEEYVKKTAAVEGLFGLL